MKVTSIILAVAVNAANEDDKKVPPRRPEQRLARLNQFSAEWLDDNVPNLPSIQSWKNKFEKNAERILRAYNRPECGFFDPNVLPHGGPDANVDLRPNLSPRRPITDDRKRRETDPTDGGMIDENGFLRYDKTNPLRGIKQITTGYRKWAERYINECWGQRKHKYQITRMNSWWTLLSDHYKAHAQQYGL